MTTEEETSGYAFATAWINAFVSSSLGDESNICSSALGSSFRLAGHFLLSSSIACNTKNVVIVYRGGATTTQQYSDWKGVVEGIN